MGALRPRMAMMVLLLAVAALHGADATFPRRASTAAFPHYPQREVFSLTGDWDFTFMNYTDYMANSTVLPANLSFDKQQLVPSAWDAAWGTGLQYSRGAGFYRARVSIPAGKPAAIHFEACSLFCRVFVDGIPIANSTRGGFTPFWVDVPTATNTNRTITVMASNVFDRQLTPTQAAYYDFYQYGGLVREVTLHVLPDSPSVQRVTVDPVAAAGVPNGEVNVTAVLRGTTQNSTVALGLCWDIATDAPPCTAAETYTPENGIVSLRNIAVPNWKLWSPTEPNLHTLTVVVRYCADCAVEDSIQVRFGLRTVSTAGRHITINGEPIKLKGYNRHDMYPQLGPSLTDQLYDSDLQLLTKTLKGNFVRGSHYPQDPRLLDRCDELGVLVWEETLAWGNWAPILTEPAFLNASLATANAMLDRDTNHPAIILWGFFNEGQSDKNESVPSYAAMANAFRSRDSTRLITWADNRGVSSKCYEYADVISNNYYPGWYNGPPSGISQIWSDRAAWVAEKYPNKPFIISETGAGGIVGNHSTNSTRWSLELQSNIDGLDASVAMTNGNITGLALWQFSDIKVDQSNSSTGRPGGINNKGVVSQIREPKPAAITVGMIYSKLN